MSENDKNPGGGKVEVRRKGGYTVVLDAIIDREDIGGNDLLVYLVLCRFADKAGECWPSYQTIADRAGIARSTAAKSLKNLEALGVLSHKRQHGDKGQTSNLYTVLDDTVCQTDSPPKRVRETDSPSPADGLTPVRETDTKDSHRKDSQEGGAKIKQNELFEKLNEVSQLYADFPPTLGSDERNKAVELAKKHKAHVLLDAWRAYQKKKPGKPFRFFLEDGGVQKFYKEKPKPKQDIICPECKRIVPQLFSDTGHCQECENKALHEADPSFEPIDFQGLLQSLTEKKTVHRQAV